MSSGRKEPITWMEKKIAQWAWSTSTLYFTEPPDWLISERWHFYPTLLSPQYLRPLPRRQIGSRWFPALGTGSLNALVPNKRSALPQQPYSWAPPYVHSTGRRARAGCRGWRQLLGISFSLINTFLVSAIYEQRDSGLIQVGKPKDNFNGRYTDVCLNVNWLLPMEGSQKEKEA